MALTKLLLALASGFALAASAQAQTYPSKPIRLIVPFAPGGTADIVARVGGDRLGKEPGQPVLIGNRGGAPALSDPLGGQVDMMFDNLPSSMSHLQAGRLRPLAIAWNKRIDALPNVPTFAEPGLKQVSDPAWYGWVAPAKTPEDILRKINVAVVSVLQQPDVKERLKAGGAEVLGNTPAEHAAEIKAGLAKMQT